MFSYSKKGKKTTGKEFRSLARCFCRIRDYWIAIFAIAVIPGLIWASTLFICTVTT